MTHKEYPRRVKELQSQLQQINGNGGDLLTAEKSRQLIKKIGETQLDLWDFVLDMQTTLNKIGNAALAIAVSVAIGVLGWLLTYVLPKIIAII